MIQTEFKPLIALIKSYDGVQYFYCPNKEAYNKVISKLVDGIKEDILRRKPKNPNLDEEIIKSLPESLKDDARSKLYYYNAMLDNYNKKLKMIDELYLALSIDDHENIFDIIENYCEYLGTFNVIDIIYPSDPEVDEMMPLSL